jgi:hypothetical protein
MLRLSDLIIFIFIFIFIYLIYHHFYISTPKIIESLEMLKIPSTIDINFSTKQPFGLENLNHEIEILQKKQKETLDQIERIKQNIQKNN